ncbi:MAG: germination protein YpeB [Eubacterium sp.]|nr:germination protein YpeB [Eubacterium sp.]
MTRRRTVRIISYVIFALAVLIAFAVINTRSMTAYKQQLEVSYQHSLTELSESLDTVNTDLTKVLYSNSPSELLTLSRDLFAQCATAKNAVSRLPVSQMELGNIYKFLSQAGDYAQYIGAKLERGEMISEQEHSNLAGLLKYARQFADEADEMVQTVAAGARITDGSVKNTVPLSAGALDTSFSTGAKAFEAFPTLLYDGPFSDQVLNKKSQLLDEAEVKSKEECLALAAKALHVSQSKLSFEADEQSLLPCYTFKSGRYTVSVTKQGGYIKNILYSGVANAKNISEANALALAEGFLDSIGYQNMTESYYATVNNVCTINFAYRDGEMICYPDLIKVSVSMENGAIVGIDATTYLTNHTDRSAFSSALSQDEALARLSPYLNAHAVKACLIPKENGTEAQCWELNCTSTDTGEDTLVYINAQTGQEEDIMLLLYTDDGTMVK